MNSIALAQLAAKSRGAQIFFDTIWVAVGTTTSATNLPDADANFDVDASGQQILPTSTTLTSDRVYTLQAPAAGRKGGFLFNYIRFNTDAHSTQVKDGPSNNVIFPVGSDTEPAPSYMASFFWDGTNWSFVGYIPLTVTT